jgi:hypothetical protein
MSAPAARAAKTATARPREDARGRGEIGGAARAA